MSWWDQLSVIQQGALTFTLVVGAVTLLWRRFLVPVVHYQAAHPILMEIAAEFKPNNGVSLHDRMVRIEETLNRMDNRLDKIDNRLDTIDNHQS